MTVDYCGILRYGIRTAGIRSIDLCYPLIQQQLGEYLHDHYTNFECSNITEASGKQSR